MLSNRLEIRYPKHLSESVSQALYANDLYEHVDSLLGYGLAQHGAPEGHHVTRFGWQRYLALEQVAIENGPMGADELHVSDDEPAEAWEGADKEAARYDEWVADVTRGLAETTPTAAAQASELAPFVRFMRRSVENQVYFHLLYGPEVYNPWQPLARILERGILLSAGAGKTPDRTDLTFHSRGRTGRTGSMTVGPRYVAQQIVYDYLSREAQGFREPKNGEQLVARLERINDPHVQDQIKGLLKKETLQVQVLAPMKRAGVIGSVNAGYFVLTTPEDCEQSIAFHDSKVNAMRIVIDATKRTREALETNRIA
ncbi:hypothetical protein FJZ36_09385 [Candidatus Poribacteria bacterium]|nr:hypothetical protein [Candidatus Poribacteria bacterium]